MKVRIQLTVDIDPKAWDLDFGTGLDPAAVREDVRRYCDGTVVEQLASLGYLREGQA